MNVPRIDVHEVSGPVTYTSVAITPRSPCHSAARAVTVVARTCAQAEVAAKAALVAGPLEGADLLRRLGLPALIIPHPGHPIAIGEWPGGDAWT